jgi:phosphatidylinositol glycan class K
VSPRYRQIFLTGHGGDGFIKFQDVQELIDQDLADALQQMHEKKRYNEILLVVETCEAATLIEKVAAPNIVATASSVRGEIVREIRQASCARWPA